MSGWVELKVEEEVCELDRLDNITMSKNNNGDEVLRDKRRKTSKKV